MDLKVEGTVIVDKWVRKRKMIRLNFPWLIGTFDFSTKQTPNSLATFNRPLISTTYSNASDLKNFKWVPSVFIKEPSTISTRTKSIDLRLRRFVHFIKYNNDWSENMSLFIFCTNYVTDVTTFTNAPGSTYSGNSSLRAEIRFYQ